MFLQMVSPDNYLLDVKVSVSNQTDQAREIQPSFFLGSGNEVIPQETQSQPKEAAGYIDESLETWDDGDFEKSLVVSGLDWLGVTDKYFVTAVKSPSADWKGKLVSQSGLLKGKEVKVPAASIQGKAISLEAGQSWTESFQLFMGPKEEAELIKFDQSLTNTLDFGWFSFIAHPLLELLRMLQDYVLNWGVAIIILTIIVRLLMAPLALKGMMSMRKMSTLGPKMKKLKEKYKNDKERLNKETMELYKKNGVNPMGGCLPMLLQIPIFIGLYQALLPAIELRHAGFALWMTDLSAPDHTLILPILMGVSMFFQQKLTPSANMDPTQAKMMRYFPIVMTFFFLNFPTGLVLYWVVSNLISIGQQLIFNKIKIQEAID
jgi:YidC/Oxa1 family membrane protein insertase